MADSPFIPYGRHLIDEDDLAAVAAVLRSDWLTTGPKVEEFEASVAAFTGAAHGVAVCNGTAALHAAMYALGIGPGDEVIVPPMTFAATANCVLYQGGTPVFADVDPETLLIDPGQVEARITSRTRAIIAVDYAGQPCDYLRLREITNRHGLALIADGCHALGAEFGAARVGSLADMTVFSFHPVKHVATGEGGMVVTDDANLAGSMRTFRSHGITTDHRQREKAGSWFYEMVELGYNYRITDIQCALGVSQMKKLSGFLERRRAVAALYDRLLAGVNGARPLGLRAGMTHAYHLYVVQLAQGMDRAEVFGRMREARIGVNVHYVPVHLHPYYRNRFGHGPGLCPVAEAAYERIISLPMHAGLSDADVTRVVESLKGALA